MTEAALPKPAHLWRLVRAPGYSATLLRGTAGTCAVRVAANGLLFGAQILFARHLGVAGFGLYVLALAWAGVLLLVGRIGFDLATVRFVAAYCGRREWSLLRGFLNAARAAVLAGSLATGAVFAVAVAMLEPRLGAETVRALWLAAAAVPLLALVQVQAAAVRGLGHVVAGEIPFAIGHPVLLLAGFVAAVAWLGAAPAPATALTVYLLATLAALLGLFPVLRRIMPREARRAPPAYLWGEWLRTAPAMMLIAGFSVVLSQTTTIMVGLLAGAPEAGLYGAASKVAAVLQIISFSLASALAPMAARLHAQGEHDRLQRAVGVGVRTVFAATFAAAVALGLLGRPVLSLFGAEFVAAFAAMLVLLAGQLAAAAAAPAGILLNMTGYHNDSARILAVAGVLNLVLCAVLIPPFGLMGAAVATAATMATWNGLMALAARRRLGIRADIGAEPRRAVNPM